MKKVDFTKVKVGDLVQVPRTQFAPLRRGWNGWLFSNAIVLRKGRSKTGRLCIEVEMCMPGKRTNEYSTWTKSFLAENVFYTNAPQNARLILLINGYKEGQNLEEWIKENEAVGCDWIRFLNDKGYLFPVQG